LWSGWLLSGARSPSAQTVSNVGLSVVPFVAAAACLRRAGRLAGRLRLSWGLLGASCAAWGVGQVIWTIYETGLGREVPFPSLADAGYLAAVPLATAGLLAGRRATTHWAWCDALAREHGDVDVQADPIYVRDGAVWTSAGVTAGMDLALALVQDDLGPAIALEAARWLVLFLKRPGGQSQFSAGLAAQAAAREPLRELQAWIAGHLDADLSVPALAARACLSERHFARAWRAETGLTPAAYVEGLRIERARALLQDGARVDAAARAAGFAGAEVMRRVFHRRLGVGPAAYRERFRSAAA
jgi:transcriptional regulator GlxA family with amidase domain